MVFELKKMSSSEILSAKERDILARNTKKVKLSQEEGSLTLDDAEMVVAEVESDVKHKRSSSTGGTYKGKVLSLAGIPHSSMLENELRLEEIVQLIEEEVFPELGVEKIDDQPLREFNPKPYVKISMEEY